MNLYSLNNTKYANRQKFEQLRSRWEAVQQSKMVGRKEKPAAYQLFIMDLSRAPSKFRRKLSYGLSFISNPLAQRKATPTRQANGQPLLSSIGYGVSPTANLPLESDRLLPSVNNPVSYDDPLPEQSAPSNVVLGGSLEPDALPKHLPRSHTMSFIPRPRRSESGSSITELEQACKTHPPVFTPGYETGATTTKIPIPNPTVPACRHSSPCQHIYNLAAQQVQHALPSNGIVKADSQPPKKASIRSYTTPNLVKHTRFHRQTGSMEPYNSMQTSSSIAEPLKATQKENSNPPGPRCGKRLSQIEELSPRRESPTASTAILSRRSIGARKTLVQSKRTPTTPPTATKPKSSHIVPQAIPLATQRALPKKQSPLTPLKPLLHSNGNTITQSRLMGPVNPPTPLVMGHAATRPALPRASTEKDFRRRTFRKPVNRSGGMLLQSPVGVGIEVRTAHSFAFHTPHASPTPPMPVIPEQYKSSSMPILIYKKHTTLNIPQQHRARQVKYVEDSGRASVEVAAEDNLPATTYDKESKQVRRQSIDGSTTLPTTKGSEDEDEITMSPRLWSIFDYSIENADTKPLQQVKDYMPAMYWAGRFQSRLDQWRSQAMGVELDQNHKAEGQLGQLVLGQEKVAACYIFLQLRNLCISSQATDSLWEFEFKYRQEHNMLGTTFDLPQFNQRKQDRATPRQGPIGRAVRKLTPRKSSFVNLLKGRGWSREEVKTTNSIYESSDDDS